jgi:hypothetical protein
VYRAAHCFVAAVGCGYRFARGRSRWGRPRRRSSTATTTFRDIAHDHAHDHVSRSRSRWTSFRAPDYPRGGVGVNSKLAIAVTSFFLLVGSSNECTRVMTTMRGLADALAMYKARYGRFPSDSSWLRDMVTSTAEHKAVLALVPHDDWGRPFQYRYDGSKPEQFRLFSAGRDGIAGNADDISFENGFDQCPRLGCTCASSL